jgi:hypothetical protein
MPFNMRPPGLSAILAPLVAWRGFDFHAINLVIGAFGVGLVAMLYVLARPRVGTLAAVCIAVVVWMSPAMRSMSNQAMSDVPGAALTFACLALERRVRRSPSTRGDVATGLAIAAAMYVRTVNLLLVPAILASRWLAPASPAAAGEMRKRSVPGALALAGIPILLLVPWFVRNARHHPPWPATQTASATYVSNFLNVDGGDPSSRRVALREYLPRIPGQVGETLAAIGRRLEPGPVDAGHAALGAVVVLALVGSAARRRGATEIFAVLALLELAVHPAFDERFVLPIAAVGLVALVELARGASGARSRRGSRSSPSPRSSSRSSCSISIRGRTGRRSRRTSVRGASSPRRGTRACRRTRASRRTSAGTGPSSSSARSTACSSPRGEAADRRAPRRSSTRTASTP